MNLIEPSDCVRDLGVYIDCNLTMRSHILKMAGGCYSVLRQLRSVCDSVPTDVFCMLVGSLVVSRLDYCNATLAGVSTTLLRHFQSVMNAAARTITGLPRRHISGLH
jgi:hypothetical protein